MTSGNHELMKPTYRYFHCVSVDKYSMDGRCWLLICCSSFPFSLYRYREKLPSLIKGRKEPHVLYDELVQIAKWRLMVCLL